MRSPLTVRISDGVRDQQVTRFVKGLRFTKTAPGGHHSASVSIEAPEGVLSNLGSADRLFIYDGRNADTVWDGYVENPGRVSALGGDRFDVSVMGGVSLAADNAKAVVFRSTDLGGPQWARATSVESAQAGLDGGGIKLQFQPGSPVGTDSSVSMVNTILESTGQLLGAIAATFVCGQSGGPKITIGFRNLDGTFQGLAQSQPTLDTGGPYSIFATPNGSPADFVFGSTRVFALQLTHSGGATNITNDTVWVRFLSVTVSPALKDKSGVVLSATPAATVLAHQVVEHILGDMLPLVDGSSALVDGTTFPIDHLTYLDGVKPHQILDDLALYEPDLLWEILESNAAGKHRFAYRYWPTTPRYEISGREFTETGGEVDLCNRIVVSWTDDTEVEQTTVRTAVVPELGSRVRDAEPVTLPAGMGSEANAMRLGDEVLAALNTPTHAGTAVVSQPIFDRLTSRTVMPWEIEPGYLVRVRSHGYDLRLTEMTYDDTNCSASLTLGSPTLSTAQRIARLGARR